MKYYLVYVDIWNNKPFMVNSYDTEEAQLRQYAKDKCDPDVKVFIVNEVN